MNEDMSEILNKLGTIINNSSNNSSDSENNSVSGNPSISPEMLSGMLEMLNSKNSDNNNSSNNTENTSSNIDFETILKFKEAFEKMNSKDDSRAKLLLALKPYLRAGRKEKVEQYIQLFNLSKIIDIFGHSSGGDNKK